MRGISLAMGLVGVLGFSATTAAAEDLSFYVGGGVGQYDAQVDHPVSTAAATSVGVACAVGTPAVLDACQRNYQDSAAVWAVFGGVQVLSWLAVQADYEWYDKGQSQIPINSSRNFTVSGDAWEVSLRPSLPLGEHFEIYTRLGWNWYNIDGKYQYVKGGSDSDDAGMVAGGVAFKFSKSFALEAEYEYVDVDNGALSAATVRAVYHFSR